MGNVTVSLLLPYPPWLVTYGEKVSVQISNTMCCYTDFCFVNTVTQNNAARSITTSKSKLASSGKAYWQINPVAFIWTIRRPVKYSYLSPLGTGWERCRSGRTLRQFYRKSSKMETRTRCRTEESSTKLNNKKEQIIGFLQETTVSRTTCNNPQSAQTDSEIANTRVSL